MYLVKFVGGGVKDENAAAELKKVDVFGCSCGFACFWRVQLWRSSEA